VPVVEAPSQTQDSSLISRATRAQPIVGLRVWRVRLTGRHRQLIGLHRETAWPPGRAEVAYCHARHGVPFPRYCHCGLWAYLSATDVKDFLRRAHRFNDRPPPARWQPANEGVASLARSMNGPHIVGRVDLWVTVRISDGGLGSIARAQYARVTAIARFPGTDDGLVAELAHSYRVPQIAGDCLTAADFTVANGQAG